jgi:uncharacterized membrane protein (UPF0127 family)
MESGLRNGFKSSFRNWQALQVWVGIDFNVLTQCNENRCRRPCGHAGAKLIQNGGMKKSIVYALLLTVALALPVRAQETPQMNLQRVTLQAGFHQIDTQLAMTPEQQATGLMHRREMPQHEGMLFVFPQTAKQCFWMKNTLIPLTAAFLADDGTIVNLEDMKPQSTESHCSTRPVRFVLEMNVGWFSKKGLKAGSKISGIPFGN